MIGFEPARPRYVLPFAGKDYEVFGTMEVIEAIEHALKEGVLQVCVRVIEMGVTDTSRLLAAILLANGYSEMAPRAVAEAIHNKLGINSHAFTAIRIHLNCFLRIVLEPPELREEMAQRMGEVIGKLNALSASPGENTSSSA